MLLMLNCTVNMEVCMTHYTWCAYRGVQCVQHTLFASPPHPIVYSKSCLEGRQTTGGGDVRNGCFFFVSLFVFCLCMCISENDQKE